MPKRTDIKSILILGAGPIVIGQACEFDYSGAQACKALREEGYRVILVNSNPATIMTDPEMADATYIEPIHWEVVRKIIEKERPDAVLPTMGGQTALNCALELERQGVLEEFGVTMIGATADAIDKAEDRRRFDVAMKKIGLETARSGIAHTMEEALAVAADVGFPCIIRPSFTMGGSGGGIAYNREEFEEICARGLDLSPTKELLIDESLIGWKEYEMEVVRDKNDNCIIVCSIENFDAMGIHTGDSITVAPAQTLTDKEYQIMRNASMAVLREIGVETGGSNVQFAVNPKNGRLIVIEMNPRVSRSSALASKATGFPIAKVAAKLAVGYTLDELMNDITGGRTPASFEPSIDYCVVKVPRFAFEKFQGTDDTLSTRMKAVGEVMAIGRTFEESLGKAMRSLENGRAGLGADGKGGEADASDEALEDLVARPTAERIFYLAEALRRGWTVERASAASRVDPFFVARMADIVRVQENLRGMALDELDADAFRLLKRMGLADAQIAHLTGSDELTVRTCRKMLGVRPAFKTVDTCAAEFDAETPYYYSTYDGENEAVDNGSGKKKVLVLGSGPIRIGQGIEFDYCSVHSVWAFRRMGYETIIINNNPETVSTDFDVADKLYFEPLTAEDVQNIVELEKPWGAVVQFGGQTAIKLAKALTEMGVQILGTSADGVDAAEDRERFDEILEKCAIPRAKGRTVYTTQEALQAANELGYPVLVRPSYVLGGQGMEIAYSDRNIEEFMRIINLTVQEHPILIDKYLMGRELEVDGVFDGEDILIPGIMEHVERAGVHSGDSIAVYPPINLEEKHRELILKHTKNMAKHLNVIGLINAQYILYNDDIYVIEVNPRSSRTIPYISKVTGVPIIDLATKVMLGEKLKDLGYGTGLYREASYFAVKAPVFSFEKLTDVDTGLGPEMKSTGEVLGLAETYPQALLKAFKGAGLKVPKRGSRIIVTVKDEDKAEMVGIARGFEEMGVEIYATSGTCDALTEAGIQCKRVNRVSQAHPNILDMIQSGTVDLIINTPTKGRKQDSDGFKIRRSAVEHSVACVTAIDTARAVLTVREQSRSEDLTPIDITKI